MRGTFVRAHIWLRMGRTSTLGSFCSLYAHPSHNMPDVPTPHTCARGTRVQPNCSPGQRQQARCRSHPLHVMIIFLSGFLCDEQTPHFGPSCWEADEASSPLRKLYVDMSPPPAALFCPCVLYAPKNRSRCGVPSSLLAARSSSAVVSVPHVGQAATLFCTQALHTTMAGKKQTC